jgi:hypothetical protein
MPEFKVVNYTRIALEEVIDRLYADFKKTGKDFCSCAACRNKAMALALNTLQPFYVCSEAEYAVAKANYDSVSERARLIAVVMDSIREASSSSVHGNREASSKTSLRAGFATA